ncbi:MAG: ribonuclease J [Oscillospiraceae bacterium]|nr:ribonuclease J [Oscillospiraceae bacterium]MBQ3985424.1 ribonuclease J [Oscillospiraceae bacterium]
MAEKLKFAALGGLNEIGKNMYVYEYGDEMIVVDCGIGFPDDDMYGIDSVIPDITYLTKNRDRLKAIILTHGHEDHIGAMPFVMDELTTVPVYCTALTAALVNIKLTERGNAKKVKINVVKAGETVKIGSNFKVEFIHVNHSIPDSVALAIRTPVGTVIHTGDYKIDTTPIDGGMIDLARFGELGKRGVLALVSDSTNVENPGYSLSESVVAANFENQFKDCSQRIIVTTFASNVHRLQQVINCAKKYGRKVAVTGRSMENVLRVSTELGYMDVPQGVLVDINQTKGLPKDKTVIITTGSQGETMSALHKMAFGEHRHVEITAGDKIIISASAIPGNENSISRVIDELFRKGASVVYERGNQLHASGHACREELKLMLALIKPKFFIPVHGEYRHMKLHAELAKTMGVAPKNVVITDLGKVVEMSGRSIKLTGTVPSGKIFVDGTGVGDVGSVVLRDRKHLAQDGMVVAVVSLSSEDGSLVSGPDIITRGFVYVKENEEIINDLKLLVSEVVWDYADRRTRDWSAIKSTIKGRVSDYLYKKTRRSPMVLPVIMDI